MSGDARSWRGLARREDEPDTRLSGPAQPHLVTPQGSGYEPWSAGRGGARFLLLQTRTGQLRGIPYHYITGLSGIEDAPGEVRQLTLFAADCVVVLEGRGLEELLHRLQAGEVAWVREFDPARWPALEPGAPVVSSVRVEAPSLGREV